MRFGTCLAIGMAGVFLLAASDSISAEPPKATETKESWSGSLKIREGVELRLVVNIATDASGNAILDDIGTYLRDAFKAHFKASPGGGAVARGYGAGSWLPSHSARYVPGLRVRGKERLD